MISTTDHTEASVGASVGTSVLDGEARTPRAHRRRGRAVTAGVAGASVLAAGAALAAAVGFGGAEDGAGATGGLPPATATVTRQTLVDTRTVDAELGNGPTTGVENRLPGTVTWLPDSGVVVGRGQTLYRVDDRPVVLMYGDLPAYRTLGPGDEGADVRQLEENLAALGLTGFTVDEEYTSSTAAAVRTWQRGLGLDDTGRLELGRVVFHAGDARIDAATAQVGQAAPTGAPVLDVTGTVRLVTLQLDVDDQRLVPKGGVVTVVLPDGRRVPGTVTRAYTVVETGQDGGSETRIEALITLDDAAAGTGFDTAAVDVVLTASERPDVLTVPVAALAALAEGGYGVEVLDGSTSYYVAVETGLFAGGRVEVSGEGLADGMTVGMPE